MSTIRNNWTIDEIKVIHNKPLLDLVFEASKIHRKNFPPNKIRLNTLISIKTGGCVEDCAYCSQSSRYNTAIDSTAMSFEEVIEAANIAKNNGVPRVCLSASWKHVPSGKKFDDVIHMVKEVKKLGLEVCCTMGSVDVSQAEALANEGVTAYNHNLDTSKEYYDKIITSRTFDDRIDTLNNLQEAGLPHCSGGIIGLGETVEDRISMLQTLATQEKHPYTIPLNTLIPIEGTPLENHKKIESWEMIRLIATSRIVFPETIICLAAGRIHMNDEAQAMCFLAGANSIFIGSKLLTTDNPELKRDMDLLKKLDFTY